MTSVLMHRNISAEQATRLLSAAMQLKIIALKRGQSIVLFICCSEEDELNRLCKMLDNLEMKKLLEQLFNLFSRSSRIRVAAVKIFERDLENTKQLFKSISIFLFVEIWH